MNWGALGAIGEVIGAAGVIVSLLYLAGQVRYNSKQVRHAAAQAVLDKLNGLIGHLAFTAGAGDVWTRGLSGLDSLRDEAAAKQWLLTIVRRENARYFERKRLETVDIDNLSASQAALLATAHDEGLDDMRKAIYELDDDYREPLVLQVLMGYSTNEIAEQMGLKQGAVLTRLHRARARLRKVMEGQ